jgi:hypothetical protein
VVPFLVEDEMLKLGAVFSKTANWGVHVVSSALLITGSESALLGPGRADAARCLDAEGEVGGVNRTFLDRPLILSACGRTAGA